jgi:hypothetical protein
LVLIPGGISLATTNSRDREGNVMRLLKTRKTGHTSPAKEVDGALIGVRKAYRTTGMLIRIAEGGKEILVQWKGRNDAWMQSSFVVSDDTVIVANDGESEPWKAARLMDLEPGDEVTIDSLPLDRQWNLAFLIRCCSKEPAQQAKPVAERSPLPDEAFCSSTADVARRLVDNNKACA